MRVLPILFNTAMVRAIIAKEKTVTRRLPSSFVHTRYDELCEEAGAVGLPCATEREFYEQYPPFEVNDVLYVRETWAKCQNAESYIYKADFDGYAAEVFLPGMKWHPSIHMPKEATRIWLRVTSIRLERLQSITNDDCIMEGAVKRPHRTKRGDIVLHDRYKNDFGELWDSTLKLLQREWYGWAANPWVWRIEFERCEKPEAAA